MIVDTNKMVELVINGSLIGLFSDKDACKRYIVEQYQDDAPTHQIFPLGIQVKFFGD